MHINHFYLIDDRDDELSRSSNGIIDAGSAMRPFAALKTCIHVGLELAPLTLKSVPLTT